MENSQHKQLREALRWACITISPRSLFNCLFSLFAVALCVKLVIIVVNFQRLFPYIFFGAKKSFSFCFISRWARNSPHSAIRIDNLAQCLHNLMGGKKFHVICRISRRAYLNRNAMMCLAAWKLILIELTIRCCATLSFALTNSNG